MATQYTDKLGLALPVQGELTGSWGNVINEQITSLLETAVAGIATINTWTTNSHTLTVADGAPAESRAAILSLTDTGVALSGAGTVVCPAESKIYFVRNSTAQAITIKPSAGTGIVVQSGFTGIVFCDGVNVVDAINPIFFDNTTSGLSATNLQSALDELDGLVNTNTSNIATNTGVISSLGTAAYEDITTSSTDATANRVTKVGDFGLGGEVIACPNVDLNDVVVTGFYDISGATLNKPPTLSPTNAVCMTIVRTSDNMVQMVYNRRSHQIFQRYKNTTWSSWTEVLTNSNFGKAEIDALNIDADTVDGLNSTQFLRSDVTNTLNGALILGGSSVSGNEGGELVFTKAPTSTHTGNPYLDSHGDVLRYISSAGGTTRVLTLPAETGTVLHDTGDSTITGSFLADDPDTTTDWNANWRTGFYEGNGAANGPTASGWYWGLKSGHSNNSATTSYGMDLVVSLDTTVPYIRNTNGDGTGTWQQIHTTGSLAFLQNQSGATLGSTATVAGSSLWPTRAGTWRNVSGGNILNNGWGLWWIV